MNTLRLILAILLAFAVSSAAVASTPSDPGASVGERAVRIAMSNTPDRVSDQSDLAASGSRIYLVWREESSTDDRAQEIRFRASADGGTSFADGPSGRVLARVPAHQAVFSVRVAAHRDDVYVVYASGLTETLAVVSLLRSSNGGATFSTTRPIEAGRGGSPFPDLAVDGRGNVHLFLEDRGGTEDILHLRSADGGEIFSEAATVARTPGASAEPRAAANGARLAVVWREMAGAARANPGRGEVLFSHSIDHGATFTGVTILSGTREDSASPAVAYGDGIHVVWVENASVAYRRSVDRGMSFTETVVLGSAEAGEELRRPRVAAWGPLVRVAWMKADPTAVLRGPFLRVSATGDGFGFEDDVSAGLPGGAFGEASISAASRGVIAWPHTASGVAADSEVIVAQQVDCTVSWKDPVSGAWTDTSKWSTGAMPRSIDDVCITVDGTYTVTLRGGRSIRSLMVGGAGNLGVPTLRLEAFAGNGNAALTVANGVENAGAIVFDGPASSANTTLTVSNGVLSNLETGLLRTTAAGTGARTINAHVVNEGTVLLERTTNLNRSGGTLTNRGPFTLAAGASFTCSSTCVFHQDEGDISGAGTVLMSGDTFNFNGGTVGTVMLTLGSKLNVGPGSTGAASFIVRNGANTISGDLSSAQSLLLEGVGPNGPAGLSASAGFTNAGTIILDAMGPFADSINTGATLTVTKGTLTNASTGLIHSRVSVPGNSLRTVAADIINDGTVRIDKNTAFNKANGLFSNRNAVTIAPAATLSFSGSAMTFSQDGGSLDVGGGFTMSADTFRFNEGSIAGDVQLTLGSHLDIGAGSTGPASFIFRSNGNTIRGDLAESQTVLLQGVGPNGPAFLNAGAGFSNAGTIILDAMGAFADSTNTGATLTVAAGPLTITSTGVLHSRVSVPGNSSRNFTGDLVNGGLIDIDKNTRFNKVGASYINSGMVELAPGVRLDVTGAGTSFLNPHPGTIAGGGLLTFGAGTAFRGVGNLTADISNSGAFHPGGSPGILNLTGNYTQISIGSFNVEVGGKDAGEFDQFNVSGTATLAGTLNAVLFGDHCPEGTYDILTFDLRSGDFATKNLDAGPGRAFTALAGSTSYVLAATGPSCSSPPVAEAGPDRTLECVGTATPVPLDGSGSSDPDGDTLTFQWFSDGSLLGSGETLQVALPTGSHPITLKVTDPGGLFSEDSVAITIADTTAPSLTVPPDVSVSTGPEAAACGAVVDDGALGLATAEDHCSEVTVTRGSLPEGRFFPVGTTEILYTATDASGKVSTATQVVTVIDDTPPTIAAPADITVSSDAGACSATVQPALATASDNCAVAEISGVRSDGKALAEPYAIGSTIITWTAVDSSGNQATAMQTITVNDAERPVISSVVATPSELWPPDRRMVDVENAWEVTDNCTNVTTSLSVSSSDPVTGRGDPTSPDWEILDEHHVRLRAEMIGTARAYTITITAVDGDGNASTQHVVVTVPRGQGRR